MASKKCPHCEYTKKTKVTPPFKAERPWLFMRLTYSDDGNVYPFVGIGKAMGVKKFVDNPILKAVATLTVAAMSYYAVKFHSDTWKLRAALTGSILSASYLLAHGLLWLSVRWMVHARYPDAEDEPDLPNLVLRVPIERKRPVNPE
jgi:hypothetical protein